MSILRTIREAAIEFEMATGKRPTKLYLGRQDLINLKLYFSPYVTFENKPSERAQIRGMEIYVVDAEEHLAVSL